MAEVLPLTGRHAVVTGGGSGIGAAIAALLSEHGAKVTIIGRRQAVLDAHVKRYSNTQAVACDLTDATAASAAFATAIQTFGPVDILVNNAGRADTAPFRKLDGEQFQRMLAVNLHTVFTCTGLVFAAMQERGFGRIINIASTAALKGYAYATAYCTAKHAVVGLTRALALEAASTGITVNAVCPGYTDTDIIGGAVASITAKTGRSAIDALKVFTATNPQGRLITPFEVANTVLWLCLPGSESITGQSIAIAGGEVM